YAVVGAVLDDHDGASRGSAYIFRRDGSNWIQQAKIVAGDGQAGDEFGGSVSINGNYAVIGAIGNDDAGEDAGAAYIFIRSGNDWAQQARLIPSDGAAGDQFGNSVSIYDGYAVVAAHLDADNGAESGSAYIFEREGQSWAQQAKLTAPDGNSNDFFGQDVSIDGSYVIVGAPYNDDNGYNSGSVYIFRRVGATWMP
ncbi:MAG: FG-GAP repeat protein, partial [Sedimentisphaerales bacterium]|nr:FG-GAP repeat protein [Sedimentisphaerales bacterium]